MLRGTVLIVHRNRLVASSIERMLTAEHPAVHVERASNGAEALDIQSVLRPEVIVAGAVQEDMTCEHLVCELRRDIARPYIIVCTDGGVSEERALIRMGANETVRYLPDAAKITEQIEERLKRNNGISLPEAALQRLFSEAGIPFDLKGYRFLKYALSMLGNGTAQLEPIGTLYEMIGEKFGCMPASVERNIRYAVNLCGSRKEAGEKISNRRFIASLMEQQFTAAGGMCRPRVSVFCSGRRLFR